MHDKVKELALVAQLGPVMLLNYYGKVDALTDSEQEDLEKLNRFAELIIRECVNTVQGRGGMCGALSSVWIKEHFGL